MHLPSLRAYYYHWVAKHRWLGLGECQKVDLRAWRQVKGGGLLVRMHSYALAPPGGHSIEISAASAANKSSAPPNEPFSKTHPIPIHLR